MTRAELIKLCRYYKGEEECPFDRGSIDSRLWGGEKMLADNVSCDERFFQRMKDSLEEELAAGDLEEVYFDSSIPIEKRVIIFYLDLWYSKHFPYDDFDVSELY